MKKKLLLFLGLGVLLVIAIVLRWPRLDPEMVTVMRSDLLGGQYILEYRMTKPFDVGMQHGIRKPFNVPDTPGIHFGQGRSPSRKDEPIFISSAHDWLRGEHYVRLELTKGPTLHIEANGNSFDMSPWITPDANNLNWVLQGGSIRSGNQDWVPIGGRLYLGDSIGNDIVQFALTPEQHEYVILYAGTNIREWLK